jgi:hypothetical protein
MADGNGWSLTRSWGMLCRRKVPHITAQPGYAIMRTLIQYRSTTRTSLRDGNNSNEELFSTFRRVTLYKDFEVLEIPSASIFRVRSWNWNACSSVPSKDFCRFPQRVIILLRSYHDFFLSNPFLFIIVHYPFSPKLLQCGYWPACKMTQERVTIVGLAVLTAVVMQSRVLSSLAWIRVVWYKFKNVQWNIVTPSSGQKSKPKQSTKRLSRLHGATSQKIIHFKQHIAVFKNVL